jgi:hypothetical protein
MSAAAATALSYSRCQTAHPPSLKLRRASKQARHSLGVGGQSSSFPRRVFCPPVLCFRFACVLSPERGAAERRRRVTGISRHACEARRLASRATGGRLSALRVAVFGRGTGASSSGSAHRNPRRAFADGQARARPIGSRTSRGRGSLRRPGTPLPRSALRAPPAALRTSEDERIPTISSICSHLQNAITQPQNI